jgi:hypothetical protein
VNTKTIEVVRHDPPEVARCRAEACQRSIEWVATAGLGKRMPIDHPVRAISVEDRGGFTVTTIDASTVHFATCVAAGSFRRGKR